MEIRIAEEKDVPELFSMESVCFPDPWSQKSLRDTLKESCSFFVVAYEEDTLLGYINTTYVLDELNLNRICVLPEYRRTGAGSRLMEAMFSFAEEKKIASIFLEVRLSNLPAQKLYERFGFETVGKRRNFYTAPVEDGLVMMAKLPRKGS